MSVPVDVPGTTGYVCAAVSWYGVYKKADSCGVCSRNNSSVCRSGVVAGDAPGNCVAE